jgi:hypothetical protein
MTDYTQPALFYTEDEVQAKITEARLTDSLNHAHQVARAQNNLSLNLCENVVQVFKEFIESGTITATDAFAIYESMAYRNDWDRANPFTLKKYTVTVSYNGTDIAEFNDIEAEDEDSVIDHVRDNLSVDDVEVMFTVSLYGISHEGSANMSYEFDDSELEFEATEQ